MMAIKMTASLEWFLIKYHPELLVPISFGHLGVISEYVWDKYFEWCETDEAKDYMKGGKYYHEPR